MSQKFFRFDEADLDALIEANLTTKEIHLWLYLCLLDPFGDRPVEIPPYEVIEQKLKIKKSTYYSAKAKLQELGLWDFIEKKTVALNLRGHARTNVLNSEKLKSSPENQTPVRRIELHSEKLESSPENWNPVQKIGIQSEKSENEPLKALSINDSGLPQTIQTISDLSDLSEGMKDDRKIEERQDDGLMNEGEIDGLTDNKLIDHQEEPLTIAPCPSTFKDENTVPRSPFPVPSQEDERLKNEEFIRYAQGKLPKARDIKRYLLTNDKTTGDRILERIWLEYQQWKSGKTNTPNSTGSEYFDNLIEEYKALRGEPMAWEKVNWSDKLPCYDLWLNKAQNSRYGNTFIDDNSLGYTRNLRAVFFRWYEQFGNKQQTTGNSDKEIPENPQGIGLINACKQIMRGGVNYAY